MPADRPLQLRVVLLRMAAGWLHQITRGHYEVPAARVISLLAMLTAAEH